MSPNEKISFKLGELDAKVDQLLVLAQMTHADMEEADKRITSLETTRTKQKAYWQALVAVGSVITFLLGKLTFFPHIYPGGRP